MDTNSRISSSSGIRNLVLIIGMGECELHNFPIGKVEIIRDKPKIKETHTVKNRYNMQKPPF